MPGLARIRSHYWVALSVMALCLTGCPGKKTAFLPEDLKKQASEVVPVKGKLLINGAPAKSRILVTARDPNAKEEDKGKKAFTDKNGDFAFSTVLQGDGLPPGTYDIFLLWGKTALIGNTYNGPDLLKEQYTQKNPVKKALVVEMGKPIDLGTIDLKVELPANMPEPSEVDRFTP